MPAREQSATDKLYLANSRQAALILLRVFELEEKRRKSSLTRANLTSSTLRTLWNRPRLAPEFLQEVADWLLIGGWAFFFAGPTYAAVRITAVKNWPRVFPKRYRNSLKEIALGKGEFDKLERFLLAGAEAPESLEAGDEPDDSSSDNL